MSKLIFLACAVLLAGTVLMGFVSPSDPEPIARQCYDSPLPSLYQKDVKTTEDIVMVEVEELKTSNVVLEHDPVSVADPPKPKRDWELVEVVNYGGKKYAVDTKGFYHDKEGRMWEPMVVDTTAYTWLDDGVNRRTGAGDGITSTNKNAKTTYGIAHANGCGVVDYGQTFHISGYGVFQIDDACGKARKEWRHKRRIRLDIRIPNRRYDGVWRSNRTIRRIALRHEVKRNRLVLRLIKDKTS